MVMRRNTVESGTVKNTEADTQARVGWDATTNDGMVENGWGEKEGDGIERGESE